MFFCFLMALRISFHVCLFFVSGPFPSSRRLSSWCGVTIDYPVDDGHNEILMNQDEIEIVDVEKELNQSSGVNVVPFSDFSDNSDSDIEIIEVVNKYEDFSDKKIQNYKKLKMIFKVYLQKLSVDEPQEIADVSL